MSLVAAETGFADAALALRHASKTFGGVTVLSDVSFFLRPGEIRGLVGKNGAGKSTLIKILSGFHVPDPGTSLEVSGRSVALPAAQAELRASGLSFVHQDLALVAEASVLDNILVGTARGPGLAPIRWRREARRVSAALQRLGLGISPYIPVSDLSPVERALVAIARALIDIEPGRGVLVLDEPTAFLPENETERLFAVVRALARSGVAVIYVSHRLDEILNLTDSVTVLRDGRHAFQSDTAGLAEEELIRHILGEDVSAFYPDRSPAGEETELSARGLTGSLLRGVDLEVLRGEILGVTGLAGSGYEELPYLLFGSQPAQSGTVHIGRREIDASHLDPALARKLGFALLPADRQHASGAQHLSVRENVSLPVLADFFRRGRLDGSAELKRVGEILRRFDVRPPRPQLPLRSLSGGNQQKALLGKWMQTAPKVLLLHEPTQGVDIGSKQEIFRRIEDAASAGTAVVIASAETEDLANICHRVAVLRRGEIAGVLTGSAQTPEAIDKLALSNATDLADASQLESVSP